MTHEIYPPHYQPVPVAKKYLADHHTHQMEILGDDVPRSVLTLGHYRGNWVYYTGAHWQIVTDSQDKELDLKGDLYEILDNASYISLNDAGVETAVLWNPTRARVSGVMEVVKTQAHKHLPDSREAPFWTCNYDDASPAREYVSMANGLLHLPTRTMESHTPELFTTWSLPFEYDPSAQCPEWLGFLDCIFAHDPEGKQLIKEYMGYVISGRTDLHKAVVIVGPSRAGKGVMIRILAQLLGGHHNVATTTLHTLGSEFGKEALIGKPFAVLPDARADDSKNANQITEALLNIIGEDSITVNRKHLPYWTGTLPTRFLIASNEIPRFMDASGAVVSRFMSIQLQISFAGREDHTLEGRLHKELAGIYNWALDGLEDLEKQGRFTVPDTMSEITEAMNAYAAPIKQFFLDHYTITGDDNDTMPVDDVYKKYTWWCSDSGMKPVSKTKFKNQLSSISADMRSRSLRQPNGSRVWHVAGIKVFATL